MSLACSWLSENPQVSKAAICTDSLSLLQAMSNQSLCTSKVRHELQKNNADILLKWVPGHKDIPGNEMADQEAKAATKVPEENPPLGIEKSRITYGAARSCIKSEIKDEEIKHPRIAAAYEHISQKRDTLITNRRDAALLAQLRTGHCIKLAAYRHRINPEESANCNLCEEEDQDLEHWLLRCPGTLAIRQTLFEDGPNMGLGILGLHPDRVGGGPPASGHPSEKFPISAIWPMAVFFFFIAGVFQKLYS